MLKKTIFILSILVCNHLLTGCSVISSSIQYTKGTECLQREDYQGAIQHLEKAVELDPTLARNQGNLACAYMAAGEFDKAWYHSRQAVLCNACSPADLITFLKLYHIFVEEKGLQQKGTLLEDALGELGEPDSRFSKEDGLLGLLYGRCMMTFYNNKLIECSIELLPGE